MAKKITYLNRTLSKDEEILGVAELHWACYIVPVFLLAFGALMFLGTQASPEPGASIFPVVILLLGAWSLLSRMKREMIATNKRIISKRGIIAVKTDELKHGKIESVSVDQSLFGRLLGYADVVFSGTGTTKVVFEYIKDPVFTKSKFEEIIEKASKQ